MSGCVHGYTGRSIFLVTIIDNPGNQHNMHIFFLNDEYVFEIYAHSSKCNDLFDLLGTS